MRNYFYILLLLCSVKTIAQADCYQPRVDATDFNFTSPTYSQGYFATNDIIANSAVTSSRYLANNSIVLKDGFLATATDIDEIKVAIQDCSICKCVTDFTVEDNFLIEDRTFKIVFNQKSCETENIIFDWFFSDGVTIENGGVVVKRESNWPIVRTNAVVFATMPNGCESEISSLMIECDKGRQDNYTVYPNPSTGIFTINGVLIKAGMQIMVTDYYGVQTAINTNAVSDNEVQIDLTRYQNGLYFARFSDINGEVFTAKLFKE